MYHFISVSQPAMPTFIPFFPSPSIHTSCDVSISCYPQPHFSFFSVYSPSFSSLTLTIHITLVLPLQQSLPSSSWYSSLHLCTSLHLSSNKDKVTNLQAPCGFINKKRGFFKKKKKKKNLGCNLAPTSPTTVLFLWISLGYKTTEGFC